MTGYPPRPGDGSDWVDPDAPTGVAPQHERPQPGRQSPRQPGQWPGPPGRPGPWPGWSGQAPPQQPGQWPGPPGPQLPWSGAPGPGGPYGGSPGHPRLRTMNGRRSLIIGGAIAAAVVLVVGVGIVSLTGSESGGPDSSMTASDTAKAYLEALSSGDAAKALSFGNAQPANADLLTDETLRKQLDKMPISNIRILDEDKTIPAVGTSRVHVAATFGRVVNDVNLSLKLTDGKVWKLDSATVKIDPPFTAVKDLAANSVTVFGKQFTDGPIYTFPGYQDLGSTNEYVKVTAEPLLLDQLQTTYTRASLYPQITLNDKGRSAIQDQLTATYATCRGSQLEPPGCPVHSYAFDAVEGSATWGPANMSNVSVGDRPFPDMTVTLGGTVTVPLSYRTATGENEQDTAIGYLGGDADLTKTPPRLNTA